MDKERCVPESVIVRYLKIKGVVFEHCTSCHWDEEDGYYDMPEIDLGKNRYSVVCCGVSEAYNSIEDK